MCNESDKSRSQTHPQFMVRMTPELKGWVKEKAAKTGASMNSIIVLAIDNARLTEREAA